MARLGARAGALNHAFPLRAQIAVMLVGIIGVLIPGLEPQLLGALASEGRGDAALIGHLATVEFLAMGLAAGAGGLVLPITRVRLIAALALLITAAADALTPVTNGTALLVLRGTAGLAEGTLIWIAICFITRTAEPARWSGLYLALQTAAQFLVSTMLALWVIPHSGSSGGFVAVALITLAGLVAIPALPRVFEPLVLHEEAASSRLPPRGIAALLGVLLWLAFNTSVWVYIEPLAGERHIAHATIGAIAPLSLAMQVCGALIATLLAHRLRAVPTLVACGLANLALLFVVGTTMSGAAMLTATSALGFLWLFAMPFQITAVISADPTRRSATLIGGAQLTGSSVGPLIAAEVIGTGPIGIVLLFGAGCLTLGLLLLAGSAFGRREPVDTGDAGPIALHAP